MGFEPDLLLEENFGQRLERLDRLFLLLTKELLNRMAHAVGFGGGFGFGFDSEPGLAAWGVANVFHASSHIPYDERGLANRWRQALHYRRRTTCRQGQSAALGIIIAAFPWCVALT